MVLINTVDGLSVYQHNQKTFQYFFWAALCRKFWLNLKKHILGLESCRICVFKTIHQCELPVSPTKHLPLTLLAILRHFNIKELFLPLFVYHLYPICFKAAFYARRFISWGEASISKCACSHGDILNAKKQASETLLLPSSLQLGSQNSVRNCTRIQRAAKMKGNIWIYHTKLTSTNETLWEEELLFCWSARRPLTFDEGSQNKRRTTFKPLWLSTLTPGLLQHFTAETLQQPSTPLLIQFPALCIAYILHFLASGGE